jgi:DNA-binding MarR family transcriptional regulator
MSDATPDTPGRFAYEGLDRVLHEKARLGILTALAAHPGGLPFNDLKQLCALTDGNLSRHLDVLHQAGLLEVRKEFEGRRPKTTCLLTPQGRRRFRDYLTQLEQILRDAAAAEEAAETRTAPESSSGWAPA